MTARELGRRALIVAGALVIAGGVMEPVLRAYFALRTNYDIEMWRYAAGLKQPTDDARSHVHVPSRSMRLMGVEVAINSQGLRDAEHPYEKPAGRCRILALGDSFTFGWGVPLERTFAKRLEARLNEGRRDRRVEVLNLGVGNYNTEQELAALLLEGTRYRPDAVLLFFYVNDAEPTQRRALTWLTKRSYVYAFLAQRTSQVRVLARADQQYAAYYGELYRGPAWAREEALLHRFVEETRRRGLRFLPVLLPDLRRLEDYPFREAHRQVTAALAQGGAAPLDLLPVFAGRRSRDFWVARDDPHPNARAHELIARTVHTAVRAKELCP